ncbi:MAG: respiratory chain complex I subunit 1 family protein [Victivallaceae bacterium]|nr:NADH-quinone oxidoreductase subunit H [Victivallaceae bacterium]
MSRDLLIWVFSFAASLVLSPLLFGIVNKVKAFFAGRKGPRILQLYFDLAKLLRKGSVYSVTSGGILRLAPCASLAALLAAALFVPYGLARSPLSFHGDVLFFFYLLGFARMATMLSALDTGSSFEGMGASREAQFSALAELAIFGVVGFLAALTRSADFSALSPGGGGLWSVHAISLLLTASAFFIVLLAENCRVPFDDPETHLELTMIHEAMILDNGGPDLALILYGASLKLWLFASFFVMLVVPWHACGTPAGVPLYFGGIFLTAAAVGVVESGMARYRFLKVPQMLVGALAVSLLGVFIMLVFEGGLE